VGVEPHDGVAACVRGYGRGEAFRHPREPEGLAAWGGRRGRAERYSAKPRAALARARAAFDDGDLRGRRRARGACDCVEDVGKALIYAQSSPLGGF
jgi:hypothetical protein